MLVEVYIRMTIVIVPVVGHIVQPRVVVIVSALVVVVVMVVIIVVMVVVVVYFIVVFMDVHVDMLILVSWGHGALVLV